MNSLGLLVGGHACGALRLRKSVHPNADMTPGAFASIASATPKASPSTRHGKSFVWLFPVIAAATGCLTRRSVVMA